MTQASRRRRRVRRLAIIALPEGRPATGGGASPQPALELLKAPKMALPTKVLFAALAVGFIGLFTFLDIVTPGFGWFLYFFPIPFWAMFPVAIFGSGATFYILIAYLVGFPLAKLLASRTPAYRKAIKDLKRKGRASFGGFAVSISDSGSASWSSRSAGFSGGGGSSSGRRRRFRQLVSPLFPHAPALSPCGDKRRPLSNPARASRAPPC